jgi:hypothetical protein
MKTVLVSVLLALVFVSGCVSEDLDYWGYIQTNNTITSNEDALIALQDYFKDHTPEVSASMENLKIENIHYKEIKHNNLGKMFAWVFNDEIGDKIAIDENGGIMYKTLPL